MGLLMTLLTVSQIQSAEPNAIALVTSVSGKVEIINSQTNSQKMAFMGDQLFEQDILQTHKSAMASLLFSNGQIVHIFADTRLTLTLKAKSEARGRKRIASLSKNILREVKDIFSKDASQETLTAVPGIRKKIDEEIRGVRVLYPRNSAILKTDPGIHWRSSDKQGGFNVSVTLKGKGGRLWSITTNQNAVPYPAGETELERGYTYFLRVESQTKFDSSDEVFFRILSTQELEEVKQYEAEIENLRDADPDDATPLFLLATYYGHSGLHHKALSALEALENVPSAERFVLEQKLKIFSKMGLWKQWEEANQRLNAMDE